MKQCVEQQGHVGTVPYDCLRNAILTLHRRRNATLLFQSDMAPFCDAVI